MSPHEWTETIALPLAAIILVLIAVAFYVIHKRDRQRTMFIQEIVTEAGLQWLGKWKNWHNQPFAERLRLFHKGRATSRGKARNAARHQAGSIDFYLFDYTYSEPTGDGPRGGAVNYTQSVLVLDIPELGLPSLVCQPAYFGDRIAGWFADWHKLNFSERYPELAKDWTIYACNAEDVDTELPDWLIELLRDHPKHTVEMQGPCLAIYEKDRRLKAPAWQDRISLAQQLILELTDVTQATEAES